MAEDYFANLSCHGVRVRPDRGGLMADAEICASLRVFSEQDERCTVSASFGEKRSLGDRPAYTVVYVTGGESLWSLAKKYSADPLEIAKQNGLKMRSVESADSLDGVDFLII